MKFLVIAAAVLATANGAAFVRPQVPMLDGRIVGGTPADITEAPYQVALLLDYWGTGSYSQNCGGSIISRNVILTAAHCTDGTRFSQWRIRAGSTYHNSGGQVIDVIGLVQHSDFNNELDNDIAILYLSAPLILSPSVATVTLPSNEQHVPDGTPAFVTGWGTLTEGGVAPTQLYKITIPTVNQHQCVSAYSTFNPVTNNMICAGRMGIGGQDACQGDSGGPMTINRILIGITSWGRGCAQPSYPGVYTRVPKYRHWIDSHL